MNLPRFRPRVRRQVSWSIVVLAAIAFVALALAEQGAASQAPTSVPPAPLPFERFRVFGIDLSYLSSSDALNWLNATSGGMPSLIVLPVDGEVVLALGQDQARPNAIAALDLLIAGARGAPIALCLHKPPQTVGDIGIAQAAVAALQERFPSNIAYVASCERTSDPSWQKAVGRAALGNVDPPTGTDDAWFPLTVGTIAHHRTMSVDDLHTRSAVASSDSRYVIAQVEISAPVGSDLVDAALDALRDSPALALVLVRPAPAVDPTTFLASVRDVRLSDTIAPQGFSNVGSPPIVESLEWSDSIVGTARYRRTNQSGAAMRVEFTGTQLHLIGVVSPDAGKITVWLDVDPTTPGATPWTEVQMEAEQARDAAVALVEDVPASRHQATIVSSGGELAISGFFVAGKEEAGLTSLVAALGAFVIGIAALADVCYSAVAELRARAGITDRPLRSGEYPR